MNPLPATRALDQFILDARCKLLDLAATLDRIDRGANPEIAHADPRTAKIKEALKALISNAPNKAEMIQQIFSLEYDPNWKRPLPRF
jgi:hypothetical protein